MSIFRSWFYRSMVGCYTRRSFDAYLQKLALQVFTDMQTSTLEQEIWADLDIQQYFVYEMESEWTAIGTQGGGRFKLGKLTRGKAIQQLGLVAPKSAVIHIDDINRFLFFKLQE
jgi:hypothetical protein